MSVSIFRSVLIAGALVAVAVSASPATPPRPAVGAARGVPVTRAAAPYRAARGMRRSVSYHEPEGCTNSNNSFVSSGSIYSYAGSYNGYSGVLAGSGNEACDDTSGIGGGDNNEIGGDDYSRNSFIASGYFNSVEGSVQSIVGAGYSNIVSYSSPYAISNSGNSGVLTGQSNAVVAPFSAIAAGVSNMITPASQATPADGYGMSGFIGAGEQNSEGANFASIVGGSGNSIGISNDQAGDYGFIGGGQSNTLSGKWGAVAGGDGNQVTGERAFIGGGYGNKATGEYGTVPGGVVNTAGGIASFAAGRGADATQEGSFVWSDATGSSVLKDTAADQFVARATGGFYFYTSSKGGAELNAGSGAWASLSDRNAKTAIVPLDDASLLAKVATLPISTWQYKTERGVRHVGPMAQDFYAAFGVGEDDRHITSIDEDGVALAAVKALNAKLEQGNAKLERDNDGLRTQLTTVLTKLDRLEAKVAALESR